MKLVIGLGNPGKKYIKTRHNVGFIVLDKLQKERGFSEFKFNKKFNAQISDGILNNEKIILAKPQTFINSSGESVAALVNFYKTEPQDIIVIHDDLDLELGTVKIKNGGSAGGHKGVQSIIDKLGTDKFARIRIGIGRPNVKDKDVISNYVLSEFSGDEMEKIETVILEAIKRESKPDSLFSFIYFQAC